MEETLSLTSVKNAAKRATTHALYKKGDGCVACIVRTASYQQPPRVRKHVEWVFGVVRTAPGGIIETIETYAGPGSFKMVRTDRTQTRYGFHRSVVDRPVREIVQILAEDCVQDGDKGAEILRDRLRDFKKEA